MNQEIVVEPVHVELARDELYKEIEEEREDLYKKVAERKKDLFASDSESEEVEGK